MASIRNFCCNDLLGITPILMDQFSSTQNGKPIDQAKMSWYLNQLAKLSRYFFVAESPGNRVIGYVKGFPICQSFLRSYRKYNIKKKDLP
ncbi:N-terminal acetyltransferase B complex catalytic subunit NAA20-like [Papaver somniferum]|uniref:N-terminal acetyltransferase B complex catalytic subunit NAA20-like n=1 Tax=Papaver somniferum TaxID=3469 RepID=UPI000E7038B6|nr:N-terminal acetyltransferase B complex catalytic subunit NAA20-like [Papaver somniferum]